MKKIFAIVFLTFMFVGCSSDEDTIYELIGTWSGTYNGSDEGVWNIVVASDGKVTGTMHSDVSQENYHISGVLDSSGDLKATVGLPEDGYFNGNLSKDLKATGSWLNALLTPLQTGSWTGEKD